MLNDARIRAAKPGPKPTSLRMHTVLSLCVVQDLKPCRMKPEPSTSATCGSSPRLALLRQPAPARCDQSHTGGTGRLPAGFSPLQTYLRTSYKLGIASCRESVCS